MGPFFIDIMGCTKTKKEKKVFYTVVSVYVNLLFLFDFVLIRCVHPKTLDEECFDDQHCREDFHQCIDNKCIHVQGRKCGLKQMPCNKDEVCFTPDKARPQRTACVPRDECSHMGKFALCGKAGDYSKVLTDKKDCQYMLDSRHRQLALETFGWGANFCVKIKICCCTGVH